MDPICECTLSPVCSHRWLDTLSLGLDDLPPDIIYHVGRRVFWQWIYLYARWKMGRATRYIPHRNYDISCSLHGEKESARVKIMPYHPMAYQMPYLRQDA